MVGSPKAIEQKIAHNRGQCPEPFTISGTGKQVRDVLHADDLIRLYQAAYESRFASSGEIFNIGGGLENSLSLLELFACLADKLKSTRLSYLQTPRRASDQDFFVADISKAKKLLTWQPQVSVSSGLDLMLEWTEKNITKVCHEYLGWLIDTFLAIFRSIFIGNFVTRAERSFTSEVCW